VLFGFNTNVTYNENTYHIQTEDNGLKNPVIISLLYLKGEIIVTKKTSYADIVGEPGYQEKKKRMMTEQHSSMIEELLAGRYAEEGKPGEKEEGKTIQ
jgi:hypothetical protein